MPANASHPNPQQSTAHGPLLCLAIRPTDACPALGAIRRTDFALWLLNWLTHDPLSALAVEAAQ